MKFTRKGFEAWLRSKHPRTRVGWSNFNLGCPLACYLNTLLEEGVSVTSAYVSWDGHSQELPLWAARFIYQLDHWGGSLNDKEQHVTATRALDVLEATR